MTLGPTTLGVFLFFLVFAEGFQLGRGVNGRHQFGFCGLEPGIAEAKAGDQPDSRQTTEERADEWERLADCAITGSPRGKAWSAVADFSCLAYVRQRPCKGVTPETGGSFGKKVGVVEGMCVPDLGGFFLGMVYSQF